MQPIVLVLPDIRSVYNVGSLFRTADAFAVAKIYLCGVTPTPIDRFGRTRSDIAKVALGAEKTVPWHYCESVEVCLQELKEQGQTLYALEQSSDSVPLPNRGQGGANIAGSMALVLGSETTGLSEVVRSMCMVTYEIPMQGTKESLNVSVAAGIALFAFRN
jgi:23S rRNA (guanosine2251-2'-O)-methyltransferase